MADSIYENLKRIVEERLADKKHMGSIRLALSNLSTRVRATLKTYPVSKEEMQKRYREIKQEVIDNLDTFLQQAKSRLEANGCHVYIAYSVDDALNYVNKIVSNGSTIVKSKSNTVKEIELIDYLIKNKDISFLDTDFGDWVNQMLETESVNPVAPAIHVTKKDVEERVPKHLEEKYGIKVSPQLSELVKVCRRMVREYALKAEAGITGANAIAALEGAVLLVENEGNQRIVSSIPDKHIIVAGVEKLTPNLDDALHVARCASIFGVGRVFGNYDSIIEGPSFTLDVEWTFFKGIHGPSEVHVIILYDEARKKAIKEGFKELLYCVNCGACADFCPVYEQIGEKFGYKYQGGRGLIFSVFHASLSKAVEHGLFFCTTCGMCVEVCPGRIDTPTMMEKVRSKAVKENLYMPPHKNFVESVQKYGNPYKSPKKERISWAEGLKIPEKGSVLYWVGCTASLRVPGVARSTIKILEKTGVDYTCLGEHEECCGSVMKRTGFGEEFEKIVEEVTETIRKTGCEKLVLSCAGCYRTFKKDYPDFGVEPIHIVELLAEFVGSGKIKLREFPKTVTYHDPCHIGRHIGLYKQPREVIQVIPKVNFVEMDRNREEARCCGAGGGVRGAFQNLTLAIASERINDAKEVGAEVLVTACPFCLINLRDAVQKTGSKLEVLDITELFAQLIV